MWSIVNVPLPSGDAISGASPTHQELVGRILADGYEPYSTAGDPHGGMVMSFRKLSTRPEWREPGDWADGS